MHRLDSRDRHRRIFFLSPLLASPPITRDTKLWVIGPSPSTTSFRNRSLRLILVSLSGGSSYEMQENRFINTRPGLLTGFHREERGDRRKGIRRVLTSPSKAFIAFQIVSLSPFMSNERKDARSNRNDLFLQWIWINSRETKLRSHQGGWERNRRRRRAYRRHAWKTSVSRAAR